MMQLRISLELYDGSRSDRMHLSDEVTLPGMTFEQTVDVLRRYSELTRAIRGQLEASGEKKGGR